MHRFLRLYALPVTVCITSACVLVIEVVATRILSPHYGNTIYSFSSVISVILAALSIGYFSGGKLADRRPSPKLFYSLILASGLLLLLLYILGAGWLASLSGAFSLVWGPLLTSLLLFFGPALLLGMLSPFAVKLQKNNSPKEGVGSVAGTIFFWSTLGSIGGSLSAGFILIPHFGVAAIMIGCGLLLAMLGLVPLLILGITRRSKVTALSLICVLGLIAASAPTVQGKVLYAHDGLYEKITVFDSMYQGKPARFLSQDRNNSAAAYLGSDELVFDYTKYYVLYSLFKPDPKQVLMIGGGAYSVPRAMLRDHPGAQVDVAEIEPSLYQLAQQYFELHPSDRLHNHTEDGRRLLQRQTKQYDFIFSDVYQSLYSVPAHFTTQEFYQLAKSRLTNDGVFMANLIGDLSRQEPSFILSQLRTLQSVFDRLYVFGVTGAGFYGPQNIMVVGVNGDVSFDAQGKVVRTSANPIISNLASKQVSLNRFELSAYPLLTDNYAPVEYMVARLLGRTYPPEPLMRVSGQEMLRLIAQQVRYGPRYPGSPGHEQTQKLLQAELAAYMPVTTQQWTDQDGRSLANIIGRLHPEKTNRIIVAAHYDTKKVPDRDADKSKPFLGANDGASGVAALLEIARYAANVQQPLNVGIDFVFFDAEEGREHLAADYADWQPLGSTYFANHLAELYPQTKPTGGIVLDMICDKNLQLQKDDNSSTVYAKTQVDAFWQLARQHGRKQFNQTKSRGVKDDHTVLNQAGIPSFVVIDLDYPAYHTSRDDTSQCSVASLEAVSQTTVDYLRTL